MQQATPSALQIPWKNSNARVLIFNAQSDSKFTSRQRKTALERTLHKFTDTLQCR